MHGAPKSAPVVYKKQKINKRGKFKWIYLKKCKNMGMKNLTCFTNRNST